MSNIYNSDYQDFTEVNVKDFNVYFNEFNKLSRFVSFHENEFNKINDTQFQATAFQNFMENLDKSDLFFWVDNVISAATFGYANTASEGKKEFLTKKEIDLKSFQNEYDILKQPLVISVTKQFKDMTTSYMNSKNMDVRAILGYNDRDNNLKINLDQEKDLFSRTREEWSTYEFSPRYNTEDYIHVKINSSNPEHALEALYNEFRREVLLLPNYGGLKDSFVNLGGKTNSALADVRSQLEKLGIAS